MEGFTNTFNCAESRFSNNISNIDEVFNSFRAKKEYFHFIENGDTPPDNEAISTATSVNSTLYTYFIEQIANRPNVGYNGSTTNYANYNSLDSRHIMFSVIMWNFIKTPIKDIIEIGGGYGNVLYLNRNQPFDKWTIIDLPYINKLQNWYLNSLNVDPSKYKLISAYDYNEVKNTKCDLVIGTHSLSELSFDNFMGYFDSIIKNSKYLLYSYQKIWHKDMVELKRNIIEQHFDLVYETITEYGNVSTCFFINKEK